MHTDYKNPVIRWLSQREQSQIAREVLIKQIEATESLISEIEPEKSYPAA